MFWPSLKSLCLLLAALPFAGPGAMAEDAPWPTLPAENGAAELPAQEWPFEPGPRSIKAYVYYPGRALANVNEHTGLFLSLHNWGGTHATGTADPQVLADRYNTVAICVDYLQSGPYDAGAMPPYDFGYLQALDALRALYWVQQELARGGHAFHNGRIYATGGSGGGNVTLMANKLAPRTFAAVIDLSGMAKLTYDIALGLPGGSYLNAGYSSNRKDPAYLSVDAHNLRDVSFPAHLKHMVTLGAQARILVVHGAADDVCPVADKRRAVKRFRRAGLPVFARFIEKRDLDGEIFKNTGHGLGDRTRIVQQVADAALLPDSPGLAIRKGLTDFERGEIIEYRTRNGHWEIDYVAGFPVGRFVAGN
jgi:hypothetical protein